MDTSGIDWPQTLRDLRDQLDKTLDLTTRHAAGEVDSQQWLAACGVLAQSFTALRPALAQATDSSVTTEIALLIADIGARIEMLGDLQARLAGSARLALAQLLPQDDLQAYANLGRKRLGRTGYS